MKPRKPSRYLSSAVFIAFSSGIAATAHGGLMDPAMGQQIYRDFAENRGQFAAGATNVPVRKPDGTVLGNIPVMPDLDSTVDGGWSALAGGASFIATVAHNNATSVSFTGRFGGGSGTPFYDSYSFINYNRMPNGYDFAAPRLNKIATEVEAPEYFLLSNYGGPETTYPAAAGALYTVRAGGGTQTYATGSGTETTLSGAYAYLTGGTIKFTNNYQSVSAPDGFGYIYYMAAASANLPLNIGIKAGDSGSPSWVYNPTTSRYEYIGAGQSGGGAGIGALCQMRGGNEWAVGNIQAYNSTIADAGGGAITWNADATGSGSFVQGGNPVGNYIGLPNTVRGATSTVAADGISVTAASDAQMDATRNLVFNGAGGTINLAAPLDLGAGSLTFNANYTLAGARLNSGGIIVGGGRTLTCQLTGSSGDEWRKIGTGTLVIGGNGNNLAKLVTGGGGVTELNRTGGYAVSSVRINGDANTTVRLAGPNQIAGANGSSGTVVFGHRGGRLDLFGNDASWSGITHLDRDANIANTKDGDDSTFTFTGTGAQTYLGRFTDDGAGSGQLHVAYQGGAGSVWSLNGTITNSGTWNIGSGEVRVTGSNTLRAGGYVDASDWQYAGFSTGSVTVAGGARFTAGHHGNVASNVTANGTGIMAMTGLDSIFTGNVLLNSSTARFLADTPANSTATVPGSITGTGFLQKDGQGTLRLTHTGNVLSAGNQVNAGTVSASGLGGLGSGIASWTVGLSGVISADHATAAQVKAKVAAGATGTLALAGGGGNPDNAPNMTGAGSAGLFLGAIGNVAVGSDPNTTDALTEWTGGGWKLGGGGGTLTVNLRLSGGGPLTIGNGYNTGTVVLANIGNNSSFTGTITVNKGVDLSYSDVRALGAGTLDVGYGSSVTTLTSSGSSLLARISDPSEGVVAIEDGATNASAFDFASEGLNKLYLGSVGTGSYSGALVPGSNGYRFGGDGDLTVVSTLSGGSTVTVDGHNKSGGVVRLAGANSFTGALTVRGYDPVLVPSGGIGTVTLMAGSSTAFGAAAPVSLLAGGTIDLNGFSAGVGTVTGTAGSGLMNSSTSNVANLTVNQAVDGTLASAMSSSGGRNLNLIKRGAGALTLSGANSHTGVHTVEAGCLRLGSASGLGSSGSSVAVAAGGAFDVNGYSPPSLAGVTIAGAGAGAGAFQALHNSVASSVSLASVTLSGDATIGGAAGSSFAVASLNPAGFTAAIQSGRVDSYNGTIGGGNLSVNNGAVLYLSGSVTGGAGTITLNTGGSLDVRDFSNPADGKTIVLNGGRIGNGYVHNGGGAQSTLSNPVQVATSGTIDGNNGGWNYRMQIAGALSGSGALTLASSRGVRFTGNVSGYTGTATVTSTSGVAFNGASDQVFNGVLAGSRTLYKEGSNNLTLAAVNTWSGGTELLGGSITVGALSGIGSYSGSNTGYLAVKNGATFRYQGTGAESTARRLYLDTGAANFDIVNPAAAIDWSPNGGVVTGSNSGVIGKTGAGALTLNFALAGAAGITVQNGTLVLPGANSHTGAAIVNGGTLELKYTSNNNSKLADSAGLTLGGGALTLNGGSHTEAVGGTALTAGTTSSVSRVAGTSVLAMGTITSGAGAILNVGATQIATTTTSLVNGLLPGVIVAGSLATRDANNFVVPFTGFSDVTRLSSGSKVIVNDAASNVRIVEGTGTLADVSLASVVNDVNTLTNTSTGGVATVNINGGTLRLAAEGRIVTDPSSQGLSLVNGSLTVGGAADAAGTLVVVQQSPADMVIGAAVANNGTGLVSLSKQGSGRLVVTGAGTYGGDTMVGGGTLALGASHVLPDGAAKGNLTVAGGAGLDLAGFNETLNGLSGSGTVDNSSVAAASLTLGGNDATSTFSGVIGNTGAALSLVKAGAGTLTLGGANTYSGATSVNGGVIATQGGASIPDTSVVTLANTAGASLLLGGAETVGGLSGGGATGGGVNLQAFALTVNQSSATSYSGILSGTGGSLTKSGAGTLELLGKSTFTGGTTVNGGTLILNNGTTAGDTRIAGAVTVNSGATLRTTGTGGGSGTGLGWNDQVTSLTISGGTVEAATGTNMHIWNITGGVTMTGGTLQTNGGTSTTTGPFLEWNRTQVTTLASANTARIAGRINIRTDNSYSGLAFTVADGEAATDLQLTAGVTQSGGSMGLTKSGPGTMEITGRTSYAGVTTVSAGTLRLTRSATGNDFMASSGYAIAAGATLELGYTFGTTSAQGVRLSNVNNTVTGAGTFAKTGAGFVWLANVPSNATTFNQASGGLLDVRAGTLDSMSTASTNKGDLTVAAGATLASPQGDWFFDSLNGGGSLVIGSRVLTLGVDNGGGVFSGGVGGTGSLVKTGTGSLTLSGANSYSGTTSVNQGELVLTGSLSSAATTTIAAAGTLRGTGNLSGPAVVQGMIAPGVSGIGTLTIQGTTTLAGTLSMEIQKSEATLSADRINGTGSLACGGAIVVTASGDTLAAGDAFTLFSKASYSGSFASVQLPELPAGLVWDASQLTVNGTITVLTQLQAWRKAQLGTVDNSGSAADSADPDHDGVANLLEYALGLDPNQPAGMAGKVIVDTVPGALRMSIARDPNASGVTLRVEVSGNLTQWLGTEGMDVQTLVNTAGSLVVRDLTPENASNRRFIRFRAVVE